MSSAAPWGLALLLLPWAGCLGSNVTPDASPLVFPNPLAPVSNVTWMGGSSVTLAIQGEGWGRLEIRTPTATQMQIRLSHNEISDLTDPYEPQLVYNEKHYTFVAFFREDKSFLEGFWWMRWGTPGGVSEIYFPGETTGQVSLVPESSGILVFATNVPGYRLTLKDGSSTNAGIPVVNWTLSSPKDSLLILPQAQQTAVLNTSVARIQRHRVWHEERSLRNATIFAQWWTLEGSLTARVGVVSDQYYVGPVGDPRDEPHLLPSYALNPISGWYSSYFTYGRYDVKQAGKYEVGRVLKETYVGLETVDAGAAFLVIPFDAPTSNSSPR